MFSGPREERRALSPPLARWLEQRGWDGAALARSDAERWFAVSINERAAQRRLQRATGRLDGARPHRITDE
eukprot:261975-Alexandrium_andersonii.AAC.1